MNAQATDAQLIRASIGGEHRAFGALVERYQNLVCSVAYSATGDIALSEDVGQETFVEAWRHLPEIQKPDKLRGWLCGTARNLARMAQRRRKREVLAGDDPAREIAVLDTSALDTVISEEQRALVWRALEAISETYREPLVLFYREGQSVKEVAAGLELSEEAAKQRLARGRQALRDELAKTVEETLTRTRPSPAFCAGVLGRIGAQVGGAAAATQASHSSIATKGGARSAGRGLFRGKALLVAAAVALVAATAPLWVRHAPKGHAERSAATAAAMGADARSHSTTVPTKSWYLARGRHRPRGAWALTARTRRALETAIAQARNARLAHTGQPRAAASTGRAGTPPPLDLADKTGSSTAWEKREIRILDELLADCYDLARDEQPGLSGTLGIRYTIRGEPGIGGLVDDVQFMNDYSTIEQPTMRECTKQSLYALELAPPPQGVSVRRKLTLRLQPHEARARAVWSDGGTGSAEAP